MISVSVVIRSTVLPGTIRGLVIPTLEAASGKTAGDDFGVGFFPEFLREGTAVRDFYNPPKVVFAASDSRTSAILDTLNAGFDAPMTRTNYETAEMVKYATTPGTPSRSPSPTRSAASARR